MSTARSARQARKRPGANRGSFPEDRSGSGPGRTWLSPASFQQSPLGFEFNGQRLLIGKGRSVLGGQDLVGQILQSVMDDGRIFLGAEDDADRWILPRVGPVFLGIVEVQV